MTGLDSIWKLAAPRFPPPAIGQIKNYGSGANSSFPDGSLELFPRIGDEEESNLRRHFSCLQNVGGGIGGEEAILSSSSLPSGRKPEKSCNRGCRSRKRKEEKAEAFFFFPSPFPSNFFLVSFPYAAL